MNTDNTNTAKTAIRKIEAILKGIDRSDLTTAERNILRIVQSVK